MKNNKASWGLLTALAAVIITRCLFFCPVEITGDSMAPGLSDGDKVLCFTFFPRIERNDIVIAKVDGSIVVKRVVGIPGDTVIVVDGDVSILENRTNENSAGTVLAEGEYFLLGDNRNNSRDSREYGAVNERQLLGIVIVRYFPFWEMEAY